MDWRKKKYEAGSEVYVLDIHHKPLGKGILLYDYDIDSDENPMPEIRLENGDIIPGCECWWIPVEEAEYLKEQGIWQ